MHISGRVFAFRFSVFHFIGIFLASLGASSVYAAPSMVAWGNSTNVPGPVSSARQLSAGVDHDLVVRSDGTMVEVVDGYNIVQQWNTNVLAIVFSITLPGGYPYEDGTMELKTNHTVQVGYDDWVPPPGTTNVVAIAAGYNQYLALKADGTVTTWGRGFTNLMPGLSNLVAIASGYSHFVGLKNDGTVVAWINNSSTNVFTNVPPGLSNVVAVSAGNGFSMALRRDGTVAVWGTGNPLLVTNVPAGLTNVIAISCGDYYAVALKNDGTVKAWGDGEVGETSVPSGLTNVTLISAKAEHVLAVVDLQPPVGPKITGTIVSNNIFSVTVPSISGRVYYLEYAKDLGAPNWIPLPLVAGTGDMLNLQDTNLTDQQRVYRVRRW